MSASRRSLLNLPSSAATYTAPRGNTSITMVRARVSDPSTISVLRCISVVYWQKLQSVTRSTHVLIQKKHRQEPKSLPPNTKGQKAKGRNVGKLMKILDVPMEVFLEVRYLLLHRATWHPGFKANVRTVVDRFVSTTGRHSPAQPRLKKPAQYPSLAVFSTCVDGRFRERRTASPRLSSFSQRAGICIYCF